MSKQKAFNLVESILFIILGVLISCSIIQTSILNIVLAIVLMVIGIFLFTKSATSSSSANLLSSSGLLSGVLIGVSIAMFANSIDVVGPLSNIICVAIISIGTIFVVDSLIKFSKKHTKIGITEVIIGLILIALGLMLLLWDEFNKYLWVVFGIILAVSGIYILIYTIIKIPNSKK